MNPRSSVRIASVYRRHFGADSRYAMSGLRQLRIAESLAALGYRVDMVLCGPPPISSSPNLRFVSFDEVRWSDYDVIKTVFHLGFETLAECGVRNHPFLISKLGSVVGSTDDTEGVFFFGDYRRRLYEVQKLICANSRYVTILTEQSRELWRREHGDHSQLLDVPTGVDRRIPPPGRNPYREFPEKIAVYIGTLGVKEFPINPIWQQRLNAVGRLLRTRGIRLCHVGPGDTSLLDPAAVTHLGTVPNHGIWDYHYFAHAGIVLALGPGQHNESSKIYYYLRAGLPVVCESPVPNRHLIEQARLGHICDYADPEQMADAVEAAVHSPWDREFATQYILDHHTWGHRAAVYDELLHREFGLAPASANWCPGTAASSDKS